MNKTIYNFAAAALVFFSIAAEYRAVSVFLGRTGGYFAAISAFFLFHGFSAVLTAAAMHLALRGRSSGRFIEHAAVFAPLFFFLPLAQFPAFMLLAALLGRRKIKWLEPLHIDAGKELGFNIFPSAARHYGEGSVISRLNDSAAPAGLKQSSILYLINFVRGNLGNPLDEVRLLAFSFLSKKENEVNKKIFVLKKALESGREKEPERLCFELAQLYWHLVYMNIADKVFENYNLNMAVYYINKAIDAKYRYYDAMFLSGRISFRLKDYAKAEECFKEAMASETLKDRVIPYLGEIYYMRKDYGKTKKLMENISGPIMNNKLKGIRDLWVPAEGDR